MPERGRRGATSTAERLRRVVRRVRNHVSRTPAGGTQIAVVRGTRVGGCIGDRHTGPEEISYRLCQEEV